ncbi:ATP-binding protein [Streptomyces sp. NRRL WC-3618]|uniref:ATP-binding protein n=1 Tax=Streptomyces sp. NRRL WC-3618 TaxID=1519490 RepID=UPI0006B0582F|nr:ATP-binding protein [Streptomyces sp. NRRL WC-3618]
MSTKQVDASARSTSPASSAPTSTRRGLRGFADRWPFQRKLNVLVGIPLTVIAMLLAYLIVDLVQESSRAEDAAQLVRDSAQVAQLVAALQDEHQQAILLSVRHEASLDGGSPSTDAYRQTQDAVDAQVRKVVDAFGDRLPDTEVQALKGVQGLAGLRSTIEQGYLPATNIDPAYSGATDGLIDGLGLDSNADLATTFTGNLLDSLLRADAAHGAFETGVFSARTGDSNALIEFTGAVGSYDLFTYQAKRFARFASEAQTDEFGGIEHNESQAAIGQHYAELAVDPSELQAESKGQIRAAFRAAIASYPDYSGQAVTRLKITSSLIGQIADRADDSAASAKWRAGLLLTLAMLCFAVWIAFSVLVRRSVVRPVLALAGAAQEVADVAGRELARVADDDAEESGSPRLRQLPVTADDEIGELAEAFNNVQTTAAALLERQVLSRRNVAEMFGNVGRRVSNLTTRQLALIDAVERGETDPALLERLYSIDHIAVRLRRNADSLMLLAGIRETVLESGPTALTNVVRAALGQIEGFQRVRLRAATEAMVEPDIIADLTLMIAELLENAVSFSPADSPVEVVVGSEHGSAAITVSDHGLGMSVERLAEENARLVRRERLDVIPTKVLGLFVVGALARRWDIDVTLSRTPGGGVTAEVMIPSTLLQTASELAPATRPAPLAPPAALTSPAAAAAGPSPSSSIPAPLPAKVPSWATKEDEATALPRRVPRREATPEEPEPALPLLSASTAETPAHTTATPVPDAATVTYAAQPDDTVATGHPAATDADSHAAATGYAGYAAEAGSTGRTMATGDAFPHTAAPSLPTRTPTSTSPGNPAQPDAPANSGTQPWSSAPPSVSGPRASEPTLHTHAEDGPEAHARTAESTTTPAATTRPAPTHQPSRPLPGQAAADPFAVGPDGSRPLRRRVRGATLRTTADAAAQQAARQAARPADADAVRDSLEEFEAAVARAHRDTGEHPCPPEYLVARGNDRRPDHRPDVSPDRTDRTAPSDPSHRPGPISEPITEQISSPISEPFTVTDTPHQNHLPEGAEQ